MLIPKVVCASDNLFNLDCVQSFLSRRPELNLINKLSLQELIHHSLIEELDILILDISEHSNDELLKHVFELYQSKKIMVLTGSDNHYFLSSMLHLGARGCFVKSTDGASFVHAIIDLYHNNAYLPDELFNKLYCELPSKFNNGVHRVISHTHHEVPILDLTTLTTREMEILKLMVAGEPSSEIANELFISELTVHTHRKHILKKLGVKNTSTLIRCAIEQGVA